MDEQTRHEKSWHYVGRQKGLSSRWEIVDSKQYIQIENQETEEMMQ